MHKQTHDHHLVIIGGGFGGLYAAKALRGKPVRVTLIDRRNFHLFQPLLYQVATGGLSPGDIASPLRAVVGRARNVTVLNAEVRDILPDEQRVLLDEGELTYDSLIVATGVSHHYFGNDDWANMAPGLKSIEDAVEIRRRVLLAFEAAERESDPARRAALLTFVVVGGGPTGVELAGAIGELAGNTLPGEFRNYEPAEARVILLEGLDRLLSTYPADLSAKAAASLEKLGVEVRTRSLLKDVDGGQVTVEDQSSGATETIQAETVLWAAGVQGSPLGQVLAQRAGASLDTVGRVMVNPDLSVDGYANLLVIGDLAHYSHQTGQALPGVAQVAMQQGRYAAELLLDRLNGRTSPPFRYKDRGSMAVIGRNAAVAQLGPLRFGGFPAWLLWVFVHISFLVEFGNRLVVLLQWGWNYLTRKRGARLIVGRQVYPRLGRQGQDSARDQVDETAEALFRQPIAQESALP